MATQNVNDRIKVDAVVIGAGMAGFAAALALKGMGKRVTVLSHGTGATSLSSGALDFAPLPTGYTGSFEDVVRNPVLGRYYAPFLMKREGFPTLQRLKSLLELITGGLAPELDLCFQLKKPYCLPTMAGFWRSVYGAQSFHVPADGHGLRDKKVGVVGGKHWRFRPDQLASGLAKESKALGFTTDFEPVWLEPGGMGRDCSLSHLATRLAHDRSVQKELLDSVHKATEFGSFDLLLFPPLFVEKVFCQELCERVKVPVAECLATTQPVAGQRLYRAIQAGLCQAGVDVHSVVEVKPHISDNRVVALMARPGEDKDYRRFEANHFVLATGKLLGGGIELGYSQVKEGVFHLPIYYQRGRGPITYRRELPWDGGEFDSAQPWARLGVWVDSKWRPIDRDKQPVYENLVACGSVLGGVDYQCSGIGLGFMAYSGRQCVQALA